MLDYCDFSIVLRYISDAVELHQCRSQVLFLWLWCPALQSLPFPSGIMDHWKLWRFQSLSRHTTWLCQSSSYVSLL